MRLWHYLTRGYAIFCIAVNAFIEVWNRMHPGRPGIPHVVFAVLPLIFVGIAAFPVLTIIEVFLWVLWKQETAKPAFVSIAIFLTATAFCLLSVS